MSGVIFVKYIVISLQLSVRKHFNIQIFITISNFIKHDPVNFTARRDYNKTRMYKSSLHWRFQRNSVMGRLIFHWCYKSP